MTAGGLPTLRVLLDDTSNGGTWPYDITAYVRLTEGYSITRGRADELSQVQPGTLTITLDNTDGRFALGSTVGGYGAINVDRRIQVIATPTGYSSAERFTGYVQSWPVAWPDGTDRFAVAQVTAVDAMARWQRRTLRSVVEEEILLDSPIAYWTLGDPKGSQTAAESSGNNLPALTLDSTGPSMSFGAVSGLTTDSLTAASMKLGQALHATVPGGFYSFECAASRNGAPAQYEYLLSASNVSVGWEMMTGFIFINYLNNAGGQSQIDSGISFADNAMHYIRAEIDGTGHVRLYVDGNLSVSATNGAVGVNLGSSPEIGFFLGTLAHVSLWPAGAMSSTRILEHALAALTGFDGESALNWVARLISYEGSVTMGASTATTSIAFKDFTGSTVADVVQEVVDTENGRVWIDGTGHAIFKGRNVAPTAGTPYALDASTDLVSDLQVIADTQELANYATVTRDANGAQTQLWVNESSEGTHGRYPLDLTLLLTTDTEAQGRAQWMVSNYAEPALRFPSVTFDLMTADASMQDTINQNFDLGAQANVSNLPGQAGGSIGIAIEGWTETLSLAEWSLQVNASSLSLFQAWVLGDATQGVLGSTTRLYY